VGLAANQIGVSLQVFVYDIGDGVGHVVNPVLEISDEVQDGTEGCLSVPGLVHETPRALHASVTGVDIHNEPVTVAGTGYLARAFQHEVGHLNGRLYLDHLEPRELKKAMKEVRHSDWFNAAPPMTEVTPAEFSDWYGHD
jgi:peptide deformylase